MFFAAGNVLHATWQRRAHELREWVIAARTADQLRSTLPETSYFAGVS
ncbi:hypothetical protein HYV74_00640 [Candidatus Uhrbacteria bacterium]|nr:hypothetical protein [Candidatus Uhrbacteria bacterium]